MVRATAPRAVRLAAACIVAGMLAACGTTTQPAQPLPLKDHFDKASLVGHTTVLVFWASWCEYCEANLREIAAIERRTPPARVRFAGLTLDSERPAAQAFADRLNLRFDNWFDGEAEARRDGVTALTTVLIVDAAGHITHRYTRLASGDMARFEADLKALLAS